jgi:hypothetical protein
MQAPKRSHCPLCGGWRITSLFDWIVLPTSKPPHEETWAEACGVCVDLKNRRFDETMAYWIRLRNFKNLKNAEMSEEAWHSAYMKEHPDYQPDDPNSLWARRRQRIK